MRYQFIHYKGLKIFFADFTTCKTTDDQINLINDASKVLLVPRSSKLYVLNDWTNQRMTKRTFEELKKYGKEADKNIEMRAVIGLNPVLNVFLNAYNFTMKKSVTVPVKSKQEGLDLLYKKSQENRMATV